MDETPVGCVFVHNDKIIGRGINDTNKSLNVCESALASQEPASQAHNLGRVQGTPSSKPSMVY